MTQRKANAARNEVRNEVRNATAPRRVLLLDAGNSRIKWAWFEPAQALTPRSAPSDAPPISDFLIDFSTASTASTAFTTAAASGTAQPFTTQLGAWLQATAHSNIAAVTALGACVAGEAVQSTISAALAQHGITVTWVRSSVAQPLEHPWLRNDYATPHTLGVDRFLAALGLVAQCRENAALAAAHNAADPTATGAPPHWVLATFGTATTVDALCWDAATQRYAFQGGIILAGLHTAWRSISASTAQLPLMDAVQLAQHAATLLRTVPNTTAHALLAGAIHAQVGAVQGLMRTVRGPCRLALAGGAAPLIQPFLPKSHTIELAVLRGLAQWAQARLN